jgi:carbon storage regulator
MLYLTRKIGESVVINDDIEVTVVDIRGKSIKLGFTFPAHASVLRREIYERIQEENRAAAGGHDAMADAFGAAPQPARGDAAEPTSEETPAPAPAEEDSGTDDTSGGAPARQGARYK